MTTYYTYNPSTRTLSPAPRAVRTAQGIVCNPTPAQYAAIGAYPLAADTPPTLPEGKVAVATGYEVRDGAWHRTWRYDDAPPPTPKAYDRYKVVTALKAEGVWRDVRAAMLAQDEDALDMLYTAEDISDDEPLLLAMIAMLKAAPYGWTDAKVAQVLAGAEIGGA